MSLINKIIKNSNSDFVSPLMNSDIMEDTDTITTDIPALNIALSGEIDGGLGSGILTIAGPSKHFKTMYALEIARCFLEQNDDGVLLFYDSEFGVEKPYFDSFGTNVNRVVHSPVETVEQLRSDIVKQLTDIERDDKLMIIIDSIGNLASLKETDDALADKQSVDMTRSKILKSVFRMITPKLKLKDVPLIAINHTYQCGTGDMLIVTEDGEISLEDVKVGDIVLTTNGFEQVSFKTEHDDAIVYDIELENGDVLSFTEGHRFKVDNEWKYVHDLQNGDVLDTIKKEICPHCKKEVSKNNRWHFDKCKDKI